MEFTRDFYYTIWLLYKISFYSKLIFIFCWRLKKRHCVLSICYKSEQMCCCCFYKYVYLLLVLLNIFLSVLCIFHFLHQFNFFFVIHWTSNFVYICFVCCYFRFCCKLLLFSFAFSAAPMEIYHSLLFLCSSSFLSSAFTQQYGLYINNHNVDSSALLFKKAIYI